MDIFKLSDALLKEKVQICNDNIELLLGNIIMNRIVNIAYNNLDIETLPTDFYRAIKALKESNEKQHSIFQKNLLCFTEILSKVDINYALLKGAFLSTVLYAEGTRTSNDIDILVEGKDVGIIQNLLTENGFTQGKYNRIQNEIIKASRREIVESRMNFGETIPFVKMVDGYPFEIDINFSVDFKPGDDRNIVKELLSDTVLVPLKNYRFNTLSMVNFIIHLCCHLYKEATTYDWVCSGRDLMLYKFSDINVFLHRYVDQKFFDDLVNRIQLFHVERECYYTFHNSAIIYPRLNNIDGFVIALEQIKPKNMDFMKQIIYPRERKLFEYNVDFMEWCHCPNRIALLEEVAYEANESR